MKEVETAVIQPLPGRASFGFPPDTSYLDAGAFGPLTFIALEAGMKALRSRTWPSQQDRMVAAADVELARERAATLIGAQAKDVAVVSSVSHAAAIAAAVLPALPSTRILRLVGEHPSNSLPWAAMVTRGCAEEIVAEPHDGDWTTAVLTAIERPGAMPIAVAALSPYRWSDGARLDIDSAISATRRAGGAVFIDATHAAGIAAVDIAKWRPDFLAFPLFKWLLGPYGMAFLYVDPAHQNGEPTDRSATNSRLSSDLEWEGFAEGACRYDRGERDDPISAAIAASALTQIESWRVDRIAAKVGSLGRELAVAAEEIAGHTLLPASSRAPHIVGLRFAEPGRAAAIVKKLALSGVVVSERHGVVRVTPHLYNDMTDVERFTRVLAEAVRT